MIDQTGDAVSGLADIDLRNFVFVILVDEIVNAGTIDALNLFRLPQ